MSSSTNLNETKTLFDYSISGVMFDDLVKYSFAEEMIESFWNWMNDRIIRRPLFILPFGLSIVIFVIWKILISIITSCVGTVEFVILAPLVGSMYTLYYPLKWVFWLWGKEEKIDYVPLLTRTLEKEDLKTIVVSSAIVLGIVLLLLIFLVWI